MSGKYDRLAVIVATAREARGWTQSDLAQLCYMSDAAIANVEAGRPVNRAALAAVEQALGWLPGMFDFVLGQAPRTAKGAKAAKGAKRGAAVEDVQSDADLEGETDAAEDDEDDEGDDEYEYEDESEQIRELVADSTIDWA